MLAMKSSCKNVWSLKSNQRYQSSTNWEKQEVENIRPISAEISAQVEIFETKIQVQEQNSPSHFAHGNNILLEKARQSQSVPEEVQ